MTRSERQGLFVRLPRGLHGELVRRAEQHEVSLNLLAVALLAGAVGWTEGLTDDELVALAIARGIVEVP